MTMISLRKSRAALLAGSIAVGAAFFAAGASVTSPAMAQQPTPIATNTVPPEIAQEVDARLKQLAPIIRNAEMERERLGIPLPARASCSAQTGLYVRTVMSLKGDETYSYALAKADMIDLEAMTKFASCTLPDGPQAKLNVCSTFGMALAGKLSGAVFDPKLIDVRPLTARCPAGRRQQASLN